VLSTIVDLGVSTTPPSPSNETEEQEVGNNVGTSSVKASSILSKDWFWRIGSSATSSSQQQYSAIGFDRESSLPLFTLQDVSLHDMPHDCWLVLYDRVYDITSFLNSVSLYSKLSKCTRMT